MVMVSWQVGMKLCGAAHKKLETVMFIKMYRSGYNRHGEQFAAGLFLILTQPKYDSVKYPRHTDVCRNCGRAEADHTRVAIPGCSQHGIMAKLRYRKAQQTEPTDGDFTEAPVPGCAECDAWIAATVAAGCQNYQSTPCDYPIRAIVRHTSMRQFGQFMMGFARVHGERITLSGSYGGDGLTCDVSDAVYECGLELPAELREAWNKGGGWNSAGSEAPEMRKWALEHLSELRK